MERIPQNDYAHSESYDKIELQDIGRKAYEAMLSDLENAVRFAMPELEKFDKNSLLELVGTFNPGKFLGEEDYDPAVFDPNIPTDERVKLMRNSFAREVLQKIESKKDDLVKEWELRESHWENLISTLEATLIK